MTIITIITIYVVVICVIYQENSKNIFGNFMKYASLTVSYIFFTTQDYNNKFVTFNMKGGCPITLIL
jgi:hypothetical protein